MNYYNLTITIPKRRTKEEVMRHMIIAKERLVFLEDPVCRDIMSPIKRIVEIREATAIFRTLLKERDMLKI